MMCTYLADLTKFDNSGYKGDKKAYGAIKLIKSLEDNRYIFVISTEAYNKKGKIKKALSDNQVKYDLDEDEQLILTKEQILKLKNTRIIYNVIRKPNN